MVCLRFNIMIFVALCLFVDVGLVDTGCGLGLFGYFSVVYHFSPVSLSLGDGPIYTEILYQRAVKQQNNQQQLVDTLDQGPVVQSIVSLTSSLRGQLVKCFTTL